MSENTIKARLKTARKSTTEWSSKTAKKDELVIDSTTKELRVGNADGNTFAETDPIVVNEAKTLTNLSTQVNDAVKDKYIPYDDILMPTNAHGGKRLYINKIDNAFFTANKRFWVRVTLHQREVDGVTYPYTDETKTSTDDDYFVDSPEIGSLSNVLFDGDYDTSISCPPNCYIKVHIQFAPFTDDWKPSTGTVFPGYPYGDYLLSYYHTSIPLSRSQARIYNRYAAHTVGWKLITSSVYINRPSATIEKITDNDDYQRSCVEFIIYGKDSGNVSLTQIDYKLNRPWPTYSPIVSNYRAQALYQDFSWYTHSDTSTNSVSASIEAQTGIVTANKLVKSGGTSSQFLKADGSVDSNTYSTTDTKNTAGSTDSSSKLYLIGATSQAANPQTYSQDTAYVDTDGCLYSNSKKVALDEDVESLRDLVYSIHYQPSWAVSPTLVFAGGTATTVTATAKLSFNGTSESEFTASTPSGWTVGTTSGTTRTFTNTLNATTAASTTIAKDNYSKAMSATVTAVYPIYYGQSNNASLQVLTGLTQFGTATNTAINRAYTVNMTAANYFIVAVPNTGVTKPSQVGVGGASGFFENLTVIGTANVTEPRSGDTVSYTFYRTQATQTAGSKNYYLK